MSLKSEREYKGYSQSELARRSAVNVRAIQDYEQGRKDINKAQCETVLRLAEALGVDIYDIINPREYTPATDYTPVEVTPKTRKIKLH